MTVAERQAILAQRAALTADELDTLAGHTGLTAEQADQLVENAVGVFGLPLGIAANFLVNGREVLVPMAVEEPSVIAAASYMAKLARAGGGFFARADEPEMLGQIQLLAVPDPESAEQAIREHTAELLEVASTAIPTMVARGGGPRALETRRLDETPAGPMLVIHLIVDCRDAMGANVVNTACEAISARLEEITGGRAGLRILSNLADKRLVRAACVIPQGALATPEWPGVLVAERIVEAWAFAAADPYRAATHNKGIMNGIDPVVIATGNDWRSAEAGAHAYAARTGRYTSLSRWEQSANGDLHGELELPLAVGIAGGTTNAHPTARVALKILGVGSARELAEVMACVGLAQNLAALRALATEGIQRGHMALHARQIALSAGARGQEVEQVAGLMRAQGAITLAAARRVLEALQAETDEGQDL